jgi:hypothetical protein
MGRKPIFYLATYAAYELSGLPLRPMMQSKLYYVLRLIFPVGLAISMVALALMFQSGFIWLWKLLQ